MKYFSNCKNLEELKKEYRRLAFQNHPDRGGDVETMKTINAEYEQMVKKIEAGDPEQAKGETPESFINIINALVKMVGVEIEICGSWVWVSGNTYANREELSKAGCKYSKNKKMWYWFEDCGSHTKCRGRYSMEQIRNKYGSTKVNSKEPEALTA